jgi:hypothetical protein
VPDQWLEVMVTGGFKVWHIIFIIIAFIVTIIVVYCCFHRCRIPRTKQEIEADLMRTNLTTKFRDYLQEFPNEPTTFLEAIKKVQELEEKSASEQDDLGAKKRTGWLKLRGKDRQADKGAAGAGGDPLAKEGAGSSDAPEANQQQQQQQLSSDGQKLERTAQEGASINQTDDKTKNQKDLDSTTATAKTLQRQPSNDAKTKQSGSSGRRETSAKKPLGDLRSVNAAANSAAKAAAAQAFKAEPAPEPVPEPAITAARLHKTKGDKADRLTARHKVDIESGTNQLADHLGGKLGGIDAASAPDASALAAASAKSPRAKRKRDKPNLSRTKAAHDGSRGESLEVTPNVLAVPVANTRRHHHHHHQQNTVEPQPKQPPGQPNSSSANREPRPAKSHSNRAAKPKMTKGDSTVIHIHTDPHPI